MLAALLLQAAQPEGEDPEEQGADADHHHQGERQSGDAGPGRTRALGASSSTASSSASETARPPRRRVRSGPRRRPQVARRARDVHHHRPRFRPSLKRQRHAQHAEQRRGRRSARRGSPPESSSPAGCRTLETISTAMACSGRFLLRRMRAPVQPWPVMVRTSWTRGDRGRGIVWRRRLEAARMAPLVVSEADVAGAGVPRTEGPGRSVPRRRAAAPCSGQAAQTVRRVKGR